MNDIVAGVYMMVECDKVESVLVRGMVFDESANGQRLLDWFVIDRRWESLDKVKGWIRKLVKGENDG